jgi:hypothetical protein
MQRLPLKNAILKSTWLKSTWLKSAWLLQKSARIPVIPLVAVTSTQSSVKHNPFTRSRGNTVVPETFTKILLLRPAIATIDRCDGRRLDVRPCASRGVMLGAEHAASFIRRRGRQRSRAGWRNPHFLMTCRLLHFMLRALQRGSLAALAPIQPRSDQPTLPVRPRRGPEVQTVPLVPILATVPSAARRQ